MAIRHIIAAFSVFMLNVDAQVAGPRTHAIVMFSNTVSSGFTYSDMRDLIRASVDGVETRLRPVQDLSDVLEMNSTFVPLSLIDFDTSEQRFSILGYFRIQWYDQMVAWNASDYHGTNYFKVPVSYIWMPTIVIDRAYYGDGVVGDVATDMAKVNDNGWIQFVPEGIFSVVCDVDITFYPFDEQTCGITYYVSDESVSTVAIDHKNEVSLKEYSENSAWKITDISKRRYQANDMYYIEINFHLARRANFAIFTLIMPLLLLAFLNICMFLVPIGSGEKGGFAVTIFLSYGIYLTIVSESLPDNSLQTSYFMLFIITLLVVSVLSVIYTIVQAKLASALGDKNCPKSLTCIKRKWCFKNKNKIVPLGSTGTDDDELTWGMFLEMLDTMLFWIFLTVIIFCSIIFFCLMLSFSVSFSTSSSV